LGDSATFSHLKSSTWSNRLVSPFSLSVN
jgi:hypothetical protein